ncbi:MAG: hypothetical protein ETSY1_44085 [Candidatus Entotheonella factor]|uniref:Uncharacterized protein n=1 Tax=Entotheonella factor TaxID=1429438 RepID=W4L375_ENTF1|nr:MAG: hypothetical protein ETSY1_44085 [Candidatus Entotheonella factor]
MIIRTWEEHLMKLYRGFDVMSMKVMLSIMRLKKI